MSSEQYKRIVEKSETILKLNAIHWSVWFFGLVQVLFDVLLVTK